MKKFIPLLFVLLWIGGLSSCGSGGGNSFETPAVFFSTMEKLTLEVAYEPGAEPFTGTLPNTQNIWSITEANLNALFQGRTKVPTITVPKTLSEMTALQAQNQTGWTRDELLALATKSRKNTSSATSTQFFVAFVKGYYEENGATKPNVIGVSLSGTTVIAMFKDVITASGGTVTQKYVEQATLIHEAAHALGLVNNGLPMVATHHDSAHGAHCDNSNCVMYYLNEGTSDLATFVATYILSGSAVMFDDKCLNDARTYKP